MKFSVKIEMDGNRVIGFIPNLCGCYVQANKIQDISQLMKSAIEIYRDNYKTRMEPFSPEIERPKINMKIQFHNLSTNQLENIFRRYSYNKEFSGRFFKLFRKRNSLFDRILIPNTTNLSPLILKKIFGTKNIIQLHSNKNTFPISGQA